MYLLLFINHIPFSEGKKICYFLREMPLYILQLAEKDKGHIFRKNPYIEVSTFIKYQEVYCVTFNFPRGHFPKIAYAEVYY